MAAIICKFSPALVLFFLFGMIHTTPALRIMFYKDENYQGYHFSNQVETCQLISAHNGSATRNSAKVLADEGDDTTSPLCVVVYDGPCCLGNATEIKGETPKLKGEVVSISPCGKSYKFVTPPERPTLLVQFLGNINRTTVQNFTDNAVGTYFGGGINKSNATWMTPVIQKAWTHVLKNYYVAKTAVDKKLYGVFTTSSSRYDTMSAFGTHLTCDAEWRNLVIVRAYAENFDTNRASANEPMPKDKNLMYRALYDMSSIIEWSNSDTASSPSYDIWGRDGWRDIFVYDILSVALGYPKEAQRWKNERLNEPSTRLRITFPKGQKIYYLRDWFLPIYEKHEGPKVFGTYFKLVRANFPTYSNEFKKPQYSRRMNLGEFVHFWSGAAGQNLKSLATNAFGWDDKTEKQFTQAQKDFDKIKY